MGEGVGRGRRGDEGGGGVGGGGGGKGGGGDGGGGEGEGVGRGRRGGDESHLGREGEDSGEHGDAREMWCSEASSGPAVPQTYQIVSR